MKVGKVVYGTALVSSRNGSMPLLLSPMAADLRGTADL